MSKKANFTTKTARAVYKATKSEELAQVVLLKDNFNIEGQRALDLISAMRTLAIEIKVIDGNGAQVRTS